MRVGAASATTSERPATVAAPSSTISRQGCGRYIDPVPFTASSMRRPTAAISAVCPDPRLNRTADYNASALSSNCKRLALYASGTLAFDWEDIRSNRHMRGRNVSDSVITPGQVLSGPSFNEPMRVETVRPNGPDAWVLGLVGVHSERFRSVTLPRRDFEAPTIQESARMYAGDGRLLWPGLQAYSRWIACAWHEVAKVAHYWLEVDTLAKPMQVREPPQATEANCEDIQPAGATCHPGRLYFYAIRGFKGRAWWLDTSNH